jgi:hypothetical protein
MEIKYTLTSTSDYSGITNRLVRNRLHFDLAATLICGWRSIALVRGTWSVVWRILLGSSFALKLLSTNI